MGGQADSKPWWQSKGVIGSLVAMAAGIAGGVEQGTQDEATGLILGAVTAVAGLVALVGRLMAQRGVKL